MSVKNRTIFVVDNESRIGWLIEKLLSPCGYSIEYFKSAQAVLTALSKGKSPDLILSDLVMDEIDGLELTRRVKKQNSDVPIVIMTAYGSIETAVQALKSGAVDFITKPLNAKVLRGIVDQIFSTALHDDGKKAPAGKMHTELIGESPAIREVWNIVDRIAGTDITALVRGESGTGKELIARAIHDKSERSDKPFVPIDCATLPETLMESELFGHDKGAFTDAKISRTGKFEMAHQGTLFLDEIGNLSFHSQMKILRAIQERTIERLGSPRPRRIDVRIVAATNVHLEEAIHKGRFREDLYYRLNEITIWLPPLRNRGSDIELLAEHFLNQFSKEYKRPVNSISPKVLQVFNYYPWPGNVRELKNVMKRAVILAEETICLHDLPEELLRRVERQTTGFHETEISVDNGLKLKDMARLELQRIEEKIIRKTLKQTGWHLSKTASLLGVDRKTLRNKMNNYNISK